MAIDVMCPYYRYEKRGIMFCECGELKFPDRIARREIVYAYCAHPTNFEQCPFNRMLENYYERKFNDAD